MFINDSINKLIGSYERFANGDRTVVKTSLNGVEVNDEVQVTAVKVSEEGVLVRTQDGSEFTIAGNIPEDVEPGTVLNILITGKKDGMPLQAEVLSQEKALNIKIEDLKLLLKELNINPTKENLDIINDMNKNGIEVNKDNISKLFDVISKGNISKDNAIFMIKNGIEITTESARAFNSMITKSDFLESNLKVLIDTLTKSIDGLSNNIDVNVDSAETNNLAFEKVENLAKVIGFTFNTSENQMETPNTVNVKNETSNEAVNTGLEQTMQVIDTENMQNGQIEINKTVENSMQNTNLSTDIIEKPVDNVDNIFESNDITGEIINDVPEETDIKNKQEQLKTNDFEFLVEDSKTEKQTEVKNVEVTLTKENITLSDGSKETLSSAKEVNPNATKQTYEINEENEKLINKELLLTDPKEKKEKIQDLRDKIVSIFREVKGTKEFAEEISLKRIIKSFKDVITDIENSKELFTKDEAENIVKEVTRMKENIELISDLNKYNTVVHIPIQINNNKSIAELYVFNGDRENSKKKINENNATMFLSLGTANMGQVESYIKVVNKTVECKFMSEEKIGADFINSNKEHLVELLATYGYTLIKASAETYNGSSLNIFEAIEKNKKDTMSKGFDAKA